MESLHKSIHILLRYGGLYPANNSNPVIPSVWLVLWTIVLQLMNALFVIRFLMLLTAKSFHGYLVIVMDTTYCLATIMIPLNFYCNFNNIATFYRKMNKILLIRSINRLQISSRSKQIIIFLFVIARFYQVIGMILDKFYTCGNNTYYQETLGKELSATFLTFHTFFIETLCYIIFITYMIILEDYFTICQVNLEGLFSGRQFSICQNSLALPDENDSASTSTSSDGSFSSVHSIDLTPTQDLNPCRLFTNSLRVPTESAFTQTSRTVENMDQFFQHMQLMHASVLKVHNIYELLMSFLGFPLLYFTFYCTCSLCVATYSFVVIIISDQVNICSAVNLFLYCSTTLLNLVCLTTFPLTLDQKASSFLCEHFIIL